MRGNMFKNFLVISTVLLFATFVASAQASCDRQLASADRKVSSTEKTCERSQDKVRLAEDNKANVLEALRAREEIANSYNPTTSVSCVLAEAFGECDARRRRRAFVAELNRREAALSRRIKLQQDRANRDCGKFATASELLNKVRASCGL